MRIQLTDEALEIRLARWQKVLGLMGNISVALADIEDVQVLDEPLRVIRRSGLMAGLRLPWLCYVARTIRLDEAWIVRRGVPALSLSVHSGRTLKRVVFSMPEAGALASELDRRLRRQTMAGAGFEPA